MFVNYLALMSKMGLFSAVSLNLPVVVNSLSYSGNMTSIFANIHQFCVKHTIISSQHKFCIIKLTTVTTVKRNAQSMPNCSGVERWP